MGVLAEAQHQYTKPQYYQHNSISVVGYQKKITAPLFYTLYDKLWRYINSNANLTTIVSSASTCNFCVNVSR